MSACRRLSFWGTWQLGAARHRKDPPGLGLGLGLGLAVAPLRWRTGTWQFAGAEGQLLRGRIVRAGKRNFKVTD